MVKEPKHLIEFPQEGFVLAAATESILNAAVEAGIPLYHVCGGQAKCSTCRVLVVDGDEWLSKPTEKETALSGKFRFPKNIRLACQTHLTGGPVRLRRIIRDDHDIGLYVGQHAVYDAKASGTEQELALLFVDIRDFTPFIESHLPFDVIHIVRKLFFELQVLIKSHQGQVIETMGDGLYAAFGFGCGNEQACSEAYACGQAILSAMEKLNRDYFFPFFDTALLLGLGLHTGKTVTGSISINKQPHTVVMGYAVNIAARLQAATKELNNSFLLSDAVYQTLKGLENISAQSIMLKGVTEPLTVHLAGKPYNQREQSR